MSKKHLHADAGGWWCAKLGAADRRDLILNFCELTVARKGTHFSTYSSVRKRFKLFYVDSSKQTQLPAALSYLPMYIARSGEVTYLDG